MYVSAWSANPVSADYLATTLCRDMERQVATRIAQQGALLKVQSDHVIFHEGDDADSVYEIVKGMVKLYKLLPDGRRQITGFVSAGDLMGLAHEDSFIHTSEAVTEVVLFRIPKTRFDRFIDEVPGLARSLLRAAQDELHFAHDQLLLLGRKTAIERISSFLLRMAERFGEELEGPWTTIPVPMRRCDIADYLGLTIETVSRGLSRLKKEGVIKDINGGRTMVVDQDKLLDLSACDECVDI
jgi:CRP/FNR family transcriptional regulator